MLNFKLMSILAVSLFIIRVPNIGKIKKVEIKLEGIDPPDILVHYSCVKYNRINLDVKDTGDKVIVNYGFFNLKRINNSEFKCLDR